MTEIGRPSDYTDEKAEAICALLAQGWSLKKVIESGDEQYSDLEFPSMPTVFKWLREYPDFLKLYTRAKEESADAMAEDILSIADSAGDEIMGIDKSDGARVQAVKLRIDTRKFIMAKMKPKKYGDKLDLTSAGDKIEVSPLVVSAIKPRKADSERTSPAEDQAS